MAYAYLDVDLFPSLAEKHSVYQFYRFIEKLSVDSIIVEFYISIVGICLTIFHLVVLLKILGSSIVSIMITTAFSDLLSMIVNISTRGMILNLQGAICTPPNTLFVNQIYWVLMVVRDNVIRSSTWLAVLMAVIRFLVSKYFSKSQFHTISSSKFGFKAAFIVVLSSSVISSIFYFCVDFGQVGIWRPATNCTNVPLNMERPMYEQRMSDLFSFNDGLPFQIFMLLNGLLSKIIPCILLPILTTLLAVELRRTEKNRTNNSVLYKNNNEKTTFLVITMTFSLFLASLPTGIATVFQVGYTDLGFLFLFIYVDQICNALLLSNASINCFICFAMSTQYRKTVKKILRVHMSITVYDNSTYLFPDSGDSARYVLFGVFKWAQLVGYNSVQTEFYIAFFGVLLTTFHISILSRKAMMTSSVISIMTGIAFFDMTSMIITIGTNNMLYGTEGSDCIPPATLLSFKIFWFFIAIRDLVRRSSTWLGVLMAFIRYTGLKFAMTPIFSKLSKPIFGVYAIIVSVIPSFILSFFYWLRYEFVNSITQTWRPMERCPYYSPTDIRPVVSQKPSKLFTDYDGIVGKVFMLINGSISKIIPCFLLPILTILLIVELRNAKKVREKLNSQERGKSTERTTVLVIFMALSFFIAELPIGTALALQVAYTDIGFLFLATFVTHMCNAMFTINSITHCLVFFIMSSQYRKTVRLVLRMPQRTPEVSRTRSTIVTTAKKSF